MQSSYFRKHFTTKSRNSEDNGHISSLMIQEQAFILFMHCQTMCRRNLFHYDLRVYTELQVLSKTASRLWFYAYEKYKNGNSARRTALQRRIRSSITQNGSDNFSSGISENYQKYQLQTSFSRERLIVSPRNFA